MAERTAQNHERTCIACGKKAPKAQLLRIVRSANGSVSFDETGRAAGRGAYVCSQECFEKAKDARLSRALKTGITSNDAQALAQAFDQRAI